MVQNVEKSRWISVSYIPHIHLWTVASEVTYVPCAKQKSHLIPIESFRDGILQLATIKEHLWMPVLLFLIFIAQKCMVNFKNV